MNIQKEGGSYQNNEASFICCLFWEQWLGPLVKYPPVISPTINNWLWGWWLLISELWLLTGAPLSKTALMGHLTLIAILWSKNYNYFHLLPSIPTPNNVSITDIYFVLLLSGHQGTLCFQFLHNFLENGDEFLDNLCRMAKYILNLHTKFYNGVLKVKGIFRGFEENF